MKWFKHYTDMHQGRSINHLLDKLGHTGLCFFLLQEMCAEKLEKKDGETATEAECSFSFHPRVVRQNLRISQVKLERLLSACSEVGLLSFEFSEKTLQIRMPILLDLLDRYTKRAQLTRQRSTQKLPLDKDIDRDKERDKDKEGVKSKLRALKAPAPEGTNLAIAAYCESWKNRYKANPPIGAKESGIVKNLVKDFGLEKAKEILEAYLNMPDQWFVTKRHDLPTLTGNLNAVTHFIATGRVVTRSDLKSLEQAMQTDSLLKKVDTGEI